jgi:ribonuclease P protein component
VLCALAGQAERSRVALVVSARVGGAVVRNRIRRRLREAFRPHLNAHAAHFDLVAVARAGLRCAPFADVQAAVDDLMRRCTDEHGRVTA